MKPSQKSQRNWYVLYTRFQYTRRIADAIRHDHGHCFFPMQVTSRKWSDRVKRVESPLFLNYLFVHATQEERLGYLELEGAMHYIASMGKAVAVRQEIIDGLMVLTGEGTDAQRESYLTAGDPVVIVAGIFKGMEGILMRKMKGARLLVRIPLLKQAVSVELTEEDLYRVQETSVRTSLRPS